MPTWARFDLGMLLSGLALAGSGLVIAVVAELAARGVLRRNGGAGVRIASVMRTETTWVVGHRAARLWLHGAASAFCAAGILSIVAVQSVADAGVLVGMASGLVLILTGGFVADRAARRVEDPVERVPGSNPGGEGAEERSP